MLKKSDLILLFCYMLLTEQSAPHNNRRWTKMQLDIEAIPPAFENIFKWSILTGVGLGKALK